MDGLKTPARQQLVLQTVAGVALVIVGAAAFLWIVFDDRYTSGSSPDGLSLWAVVRLVAAVALAGGTWLLALAQVKRRRDQSRQDSV